MLILATAIHCVACMLTSAVTSARCFRIQVPLYALVVGSNALACARWVPTAGLAGGAAAMAVAATGASRARRRGCGLAAAGTRETRGVPPGGTGLRGRLGSEFMTSEIPHREAEVLAPC